MNNNDNNNDNDNENNIRPPDSIIRERLIQTPFYNTSEHYNNSKDFALKKAIKESQKDFQMKEEEETFNAICNNLREEELKNRKTKFTCVKTQLKKLTLFDKVNVCYYELILSVIEMYEQGLIQEYKVDKTEYHNIFSTLKTIRLPSLEVNELTKLIVVI